MSGVPPILREFWCALATDGWAARAHGASEIYAMPGQPEFDDAELFMQLPVFPAEGDRPAIYVSDARWPMPLAWCREFESRPLAARTLNFDLSLGRSKTPKKVGDDVVKAAEIFVRRCAYIELFRSRRPLAISTLGNHLSVFRYFAGQAVEANKPPSELSYDDLLAAIARIPKSHLKDLPAAHEVMRWWRASVPPEVFSGYIPPPSQDATDRVNLPQGFDPTNIRSDDQSDDSEERTWQPLPDKFVAAMGEFCLGVISDLRPTHLAFLRDLLRSDPSGSSSEEIRRAAQAHSWPAGFEITDIRSAKKVGNVCQFSTLFLLALLLGPRSTELTALPMGKVKELNDGSYVINGATFKLSQSTVGDPRDWPIHPDLGKALAQQEEYISLVEGEDFKFLFRSHATVVGGARPITQFYNIFQRVLGHTDLEHLLDDSSFHPHRLRYTTARLIVLALHGGPLILRRLFGHQHLAMTLRYILANRAIVDDLRAMAEAEQRAMAAAFVKRREELKGGGAPGFNKAIMAAEQLARDLPEIFVPEGKRDQATVSMERVLNALAADPSEGLRLKQIVPGLIVCWKPTDEAGQCCKAGELPNIAKCSTRCAWHLQMPEYQDEARKDVHASLEHLKCEHPGSLRWNYYSDIVIAKLSDYPDLRAEFGSHPIASRLLETPT